MVKQLLTDLVVIKQWRTDLLVIKQLLTTTTTTAGAGPRTGRLEPGSLSQGW